MQEAMPAPPEPSPTRPGTRVLALWLLWIALTALLLAAGVVAFG